MSLSTAQLEARRSGCGGSDGAPALGISKLKTALQLYAEKRGEIAPEVYDEEVVWWGQALEPVVRQKYAETTGNVVRLPTSTLWHPVHDFMCAHIDGYIDQDGKAVRGYEGKTAFHSIGWGDEGTDQIPIEYLIQTQHYMVVTDLPVFDVCVLIGRRFAFYEVPADPELQEMIIAGERDFMRRVREGDPPPLDYAHKTALDVVKKLYPGTNGQRLIASLDAIEWRRKMDWLSKREKAVKTLREGYKARILETMGEAALLVFPDGKAMRRQQQDRKGYFVEPTSFVDARFVNDGNRSRLNLAGYSPSLDRNTQ